ncbi:MAG: AmmeMemoRadiSam system radical SAM enzyme [Firmicutes bacterium]|nr:AmmeMemoRadiSam system radical SAM enzyme [Bacillota bacterium]
MQEASFYSREGEKILCTLCPQECRLKEGQTGICGVRRVEGGRLITTNYGLCAALALDPIEKKPLYHFYPGWKILSLGTVGCNLNCSFCQNWSLARNETGREAEYIAPEKILAFLEGQPARGQLGVAYTYNEPTVWYEFVRETAEIIAVEGYQNVLVTNGLIKKEPLKELLPFIGALNVDVKAFREDFYRRHCRGRGFKEVLRTVEQALSTCHVELTYLLIPGLNDSAEEIKEFVDWVVSLDRKVPVHFSRYFPQYRLSLPPTPLETLYRAWGTAHEKLSYVYLGNVQDDERSATYCPSCRKLLISRAGYSLRNLGLEDKRCRYCGHTIRLTGHIYGEGGG